MKPNQRLYVTSPLGEGHTIELSAAHAHYLGNVLRLPLGAQVSLFNGRDGEWTASLTALTKKGGSGLCGVQTRTKMAEPGLWLLFAPIKGDRSDLIVEKATELGVAGIIPIITERTIVRKTNHERLITRAIEAAEQCGRLSVPEILDPHPLSDFFETPVDDGILLFADEARDGSTIDAALSLKPSKVALLIGPEGGFTPAERARLSGCAHVHSISLGPRILRAETAVFAGLSLIQSVWGDLR